MAATLVGFLNGGRIFTGDTADFPGDLLNPVMGDVFFNNDAPPAPYQYMVYGSRGWFSPATAGFNEPNTQIVYGVGNGVASSPSLTYDPVAGVFTVRDLAVAPASIVDVTGTANPATRAVNVRDQNAHTILQVIANAAVRSISIADEASSLIAQVLTLAAQRTITLFDSTGGVAAVFATIVGAVTLTFGHVAAAEFVVDVTNAQLVVKTAAAAIVGGWKWSTGLLATGVSIAQASTGTAGIGDIVQGGHAPAFGNYIYYYDATNNTTYGGPGQYEFSAGKVAGYFVSQGGGALMLQSSDPADVTQFGTIVAAAAEIIVNSVPILTARANGTGVDIAGAIKPTGELDLTSATATVAESYGDLSGTPGSVTSNTIRGRIAMAIGAKTLTLTNNKILGNASQLKVWIDQATTDTTATAVCARCTGAGSATVGTNANATAATVIGFEVVN